MYDGGEDVEPHFHSLVIKKPQAIDTRISILKCNTGHFRSQGTALLEETARRQEY